MSLKGSHLKLAFGMSFLAIFETVYSKLGYIPYRAFTSGILTRDSAKEQCASYDPNVVGDLAEIPSQFAQKTLLSKLFGSPSPTGNVWIGARGYSSDEWRWSDGRVVDAFTNWAPGNSPFEVIPQSSNNYCAYVSIKDQTFQWRVANCGSKMQFICEYKDSNLQKLRKINKKKLKFQLFFF